MYKENFYKKTQFSITLLFDFILQLTLLG